jgi:hypothetical protein
MFVNPSQFIDLSQHGSRDSSRALDGAMAARFGVRAASALLIFGLAGCGMLNEDAPPVNDADTHNAAAPIDVAETSASSPSQSGVASRTRTPVAAATPATSNTATGTRTPPAINTSGTTSTPNSVQTIIDDMRLMNDAALAGIPTQYGFATGPGHVVMGGDPRGVATPPWWTTNNPSFKSSAYWNTLIPWLVVFDGVGNGASNTRVEMRNLKAFYKSKSTGRWVQITQGAVDGENYPKHLTGSNTTPPDLRTEASGTKSIRPVGGDLVFHGWCCGKAAIDAPDVAAVYVTTQARLIVSDPARPDDRRLSRYLLHVGADYYPTASTHISAFAPSEYNPGLGMSRAKLVKDAWQSFSFTTVNVGRVEANGSAITEQELRAAPPPLE